MDTILLLSNRLKLSLAINSMGNKHEFFINNVSDSDNVIGYLNHANIVSIIWDLSLDNNFKDSIRHIRDIRSSYKGPIIALDKEYNLEHEKQLFNLLVDDYIVDPVSAEDVIIRVELRIKRTVDVPKQDLNKAKNEYHYGQFTVDLKHFQVKYDDQVMALTPKEFYLMYYLIRHNNQVLSRERIYNGIWNENEDQFSYISSRIVDIHISHIRDKLKKYTEGKSKIETVRGFGYIFK